MTNAKPSPIVPPANPLMYRLVVFATGAPLWFGGRVTVRGREHIPMQGAVIVAGNHFTSLDPFVIARALPKGRLIRFMAKKELFRNRLIGWIIRSGGSFPIDRTGNDVSALRLSLRILQRGEMLGMFPEGTRGGTELQGGVALLALKGKAPVVPVGLSRRGRHWTVQFGAPIAPEGGVKDLTTRIGDAIRELRAKAEQPG